MSGFYAGVGSRKTPYALRPRIRRYAQILDEMGYTLRSGGAPGADTFFEEGATRKEIYLPWPGFQRRAGIVVGDIPRLRAIAAKYHPAWPHLPHWMQLLHTRNVAQLMGVEEDAPLSKFVLCYTPDAAGGGGTGQAIRIARGYGIPVYDLAGTNSFERDILSELPNWQPNYEH